MVANEFESLYVTMRYRFIYCLVVVGGRGPPKRAYALPCRGPCYLGHRHVFFIVRVAE
jgi:hypothetical protein